MATLGHLTFEARHPASIARFWTAALDGYAVAPYDEAELARLVAIGATEAARHDDSVTLLDPEGNELCVMLS